ncbi:MAG: hypothetical protein ACI4J5_01025 [Oscillospiraceae bacterium]
MNKFLKLLTASAAAAVVAVCSAVTVCAEDISLDIEAEPSNGSWGQSVKYLTVRNPDISNAFDPCTMTEDSVVQITYECDLKDDNNHIELIWQSWGDHATAVASDWNKIAPASYSEGYSEFTYADIVASYGTDDFSEVYAICVGDTGECPITVTSMVITNVGGSDGAAEAVTETEAEPETEAETETEAEETTAEEETTTAEETTTVEETTTAEETTTTAEETTTTAEETTTAAETTTKAETTAAAAEEASSSGIDAGAIIIIVIIVVVIAAIVVIILLMKGKGPKTNNDDWKR